MNSTTTKITVEMVPADAYRTEHYGVLLASAAKYGVQGRGFHNPSFFHVVEVWENREGQDPHGRPTEAKHTVLLNAQPSVISTRPNTDLYADETLLIGTEVELVVNGFPIGSYRIEAGRLSDPTLVPIN